MAFLLDTNTMIEAKNLYYRFGVCPGYWDWITRAHSAKSVYSIDKVKGELTIGTDDLSKWAAKQTADFFLPIDALATANAQQVSTWAVSRPYTPAALSEFLASTDYW